SNGVITLRDGFCFVWHEDLLHPEYTTGLETILRKLVVPWLAIEPQRNSVRRLPVALDVGCRVERGEGDGESTRQIATDPGRRMPLVTRQPCASTQLNRSHAFLKTGVETCPLEAMSKLDQSRPRVAVVLNVTIG